MTAPAFPTPYEIGHRAYRATGGKDAHGNEVESWDEPVPRRVYGWGPPRTSEPKLAGHDRDVVEIELLVPPGFACGHRDIEVLDGVEYEVIGRPEMSDHNPFGWNPGGVVNLKAVNG